MSTTVPALAPDRLIWLPLLAVMVVALVADQARANLHADARAAAAAAAFEDPNSAEAWCRMHRDVLMGDEAPGVERGFGLESSPAFGRTVPVSLRPLDGRRSRTLDASR